MKSDVDNQKQSIDMLFSSAKELNDATNPKLVKKVDAKITDIYQRFDKLCEKISKRGILLEQVIYIYISRDEHLHCHEHHQWIQMSTHINNKYCIWTFLLNAALFKKSFCAFSFV